MIYNIYIIIVGDLYDVVYVNCEEESFFVEILALSN